jgi:hypothetical protein
MTSRKLVVAAMAALVLAFAGAASAAPACSDLITLPDGQTLRRCTAANGESYCEACKGGKCTRTSCARPAVQ